MQKGKEDFQGFQKDTDTSSGVPGALHCQLPRFEAREMGEMQKGRWHQPQGPPGELHKGMGWGCESRLGAGATTTLVGLGSKGDYLGGSGGICSSVGEVSMIRTSRRSI